MVHDATPQFGNLTVRDFDEILENFLDFWDHEEPKVRHHPMFVREFGDAALAVRDDGELVGYLLGIVSSARGEDGRPWAYVHMVAVRRSHRRRGLAEALYERFFDHCRRAGCSAVRATASPHNEQSYAFHSAIGMTPIDQGTVNGVPVVPDYFGPGKPRVVFEITL